MPELSGRAKWEREMGRAFVDAGKGRLRLLIELMGEPPDPENVPQAFWVALGRDLRERFTPVMNDTYLASARQIMAIAPAVDWTLPNEAAAAFAERYSFSLVRGINRTTQQKLQEIYSGFFREQGTTVGDVRTLTQAQVGDLTVQMKGGATRLLTSRERAKLIATTEVTRAAVEGERPMLEQIERAGIQLVAIWETQRDDKVCPICRPRQGKKRGDGWIKPPPAHPGCYCNLRYERTIE